MTESKSLCRKSPCSKKVELLKAWTRLFREYLKRRKDASSKTYSLPPATVGLTYLWFFMSLHNNVKLPHRSYTTTNNDAQQTKHTLAAGAATSVHLPNFATSFARGYRGFPAHIRAGFPSGLFSPVGLEEVDEFLSYIFYVAHKTSAMRVAHIVGEYLAQLVPMRESLANIASIYIHTSLAEGKAIEQIARHLQTLDIQKLDDYISVLQIVYKVLLETSFLSSYSWIAANGTEVHNVTAQTIKNIQALGPMQLAPNAAPVFGYMPTYLQRIPILLEKITGQGLEMTSDTLYAITLGKTTDFMQLYNQPTNALFINSRLELDAPAVVTINKEAGHFALGLHRLVVNSQKKISRHDLLASAEIKVEKPGRYRETLSASSDSKNTGHHPLVLDYSILPAGSAPRDSPPRPGHPFVEIWIDSIEIDTRKLTIIRKNMSLFETWVVIQYKSTEYATHLSHLHLAGSVVEVKQSFRFERDPNVESFVLRLHRVDASGEKETINRTSVFFFGSQTLNVPVLAVDNRISGSNNTLLPTFFLCGVIVLRLNLG